MPKKTNTKRKTSKTINLDKKHQTKAEPWQKFCSLIQAKLTQQS
jgi:hypothetical protein